MKIYVAGPMRNMPLFNFPAFDQAAYQLRNMGHEVFNPADRDREVHGDDVNDSPTGDLADVPSFDLRDALGDDLAWICAHADAVVVLDGWENSKGARAEIATARALGLDVLTLTEAIYGTKTTVAETQPKSARAEVLEEAQRLVLGDRNNQYGPPTQDFARTAAMATGFGFMVNGAPLKSHHVAIFQILLKMSRLAWTPNKRDSWVDTAGYAACGAECADEEAMSDADKARNALYALRRELNQGPSPLEEWEASILNG